MAVQSEPHLLLDKPGRRFGSVLRNNIPRKPQHLTFVEFRLFTDVPIKPTGRGLPEEAETVGWARQRNLREVNLEIEIEIEEGAGGVTSSIPERGVPSKMSFSFPWRGDVGEDVDREKSAKNPAEFGDLSGPPKTSHFDCFLVLGLGPLLPEKRSNLSPLTILDTCRYHVALV
ncbi:hypothetical protein RUM44_012414 [Polyplax serrata]|uniref:Uncharacterized protein n=1 Tax=Polyplax serrata TaxID=468196 RepID=A0ABR1BBK0_POLSC